MPGMSRDKEERQTRSRSRKEVYLVQIAAAVLSSEEETRCPEREKAEALRILTSTKAPTRSGGPSKKTILLLRVRPQTWVALLGLTASTRTCSVRPTKRRARVREMVFWRSLISRRRACLAASSSWAGPICAKGSKAKSGSSAALWSALRATSRATLSARRALSFSEATSRPASSNAVAFARSLNVLSISVFTAATESSPFSRRSAARSTSTGALLFFPRRGSSLRRSVSKASEAPSHRAMGVPGRGEYAAVIAASNSTVRISSSVLSKASRDSPGQPTMKSEVIDASGSFDRMRSTICRYFLVV
mmetsp:Transcript_21606/g.66596  ORF Transcript_21606/g.66596 Transcript_21606/m.66596 type:complete len:305 (+) Transcript_21606:89-1003(+)